MLQVGDLLLRKSDGGAGRFAQPLIAIAEDAQGTNLYHVNTYGYFTESQVYDSFDRIAVVEPAEEEHREVGGYQCPKCYLRSGEGWTDKPSSPPTCCGGVSMVPYVIPSPNQEEEEQCDPD